MANFVHDATKDTANTFINTSKDVGNLVGPAISTVIKSTPVIGLIFTVCTSIYEIALVENRNQKKCKRAADRCKGIETIIRICAHEYSNLPRKNTFTKDHIDALNRLHAELQALQRLVETYSKQSKGKRLLGGVSFHKEYDKLNVNLSNAIDILQADLGSVNVSQNRKIIEYLEQSKLKDMFATLEALQDKTDTSESNRADMEMRLLQNFASVGGTLKVQGMKLDGLKLLMEKHRAMAHAKSNEDKKILVAALDALQQQLLRAQEQNHTIGNAVLKGTNDIRSILRKKSDHEHARELIQRNTMDNEILPADVDFFNFEHCLGKGSFGKVYMIRYNGENHAGKVIETGGMSVPEQVKLYASFQKEFAIMCSARSRRVVEVYGVITQLESKLVLVMEHAANGSLRKMLSEDPGTLLEKKMALGLVADIAFGMKYLYSKGIRHRDLKAANVLLDANYRAKVCDFGLSKAETLMTHTSSLNSHSSGGTVAWLSPEEIYDEEEDDEKCDVYSFAITMYEIVTREIPWKGLVSFILLSLSLSLSHTHTMEFQD